MNPNEIITLARVGLIERACLVAHFRGSGEVMATLCHTARVAHAQRQAMRAAAASAGWREGAVVVKNSRSGYMGGWITFPEGHSGPLTPDQYAVLEPLLPFLEA